jgi:hypothetical protein
MGLDTYAKKEVPCECGNGTVKKLPDEAAEAFANADINLVGGMFSGNGNDGSFRGKVYNHIVQAATGDSLYEEWIAPEDVARMSGQLDEFANDVEQLCRYFTVCKEQGLGLVGWW